MKYLVIDFETTGNGINKSNKYKPYSVDLLPLPRANYPIQLAAALLNEIGQVVSKENIIIRGAKRLDPYVCKNCPHISVEICEKEGVAFVCVLERLANMMNSYQKDELTTIVAHNIKYDWNDVILETVAEENLQDSVFFRQLEKCTKFCTCVNPDTLANGSAYYFKKIRKWIGPSLKNLAITNDIPYDEEKAHDAEYDVDLTVQCLLKCYSSLFSTDG